MRKLIILVGICMLAFISTCATVKKEVIIEDTKQLDSGEVILPHIIIEELSKDNWKEVNSDPCPQCGYIDFYLINEDSSMEIQYAVVRYSPSQRMPLGYAYLLEGKIYIFTRDGVGGYRPAILSDTVIEWWIEQFEKNFFNKDDL